MKSIQSLTNLSNPQQHNNAINLAHRLFVLLALLLAACVSQTAGTPSPSVTMTPTGKPQIANPTSSSDPTNSTDMEATVDRTARPTPVLLDEPSVPTPGTLVVGEVPSDLMQILLADLAERLEISTEEITVIQARAVEWNDGSLGCPQPGMMYIQVITPGFRVVLLAKDQMFDYHTDTKAQFILCNPDGVIDDHPPLLPIKPSNKQP